MGKNRIYGDVQCELCTLPENSFDYLNHEQPQSNFQKPVFSPEV